MSGGASDGFRFSFGDEEGDEQGSAPAACQTWPAPSTRLSSFPWIPMTAEKAAEWGRDYPTDGMPASRKPLQKPSLQQRLPFPTTSPTNENSLLAAVCYQTAPELAELTLVSRKSKNDSSADTSLTAGVVEARDIIPGKYYGGLKVWSCAPDLAQFLMAHADEWRKRVSVHCSPAEGAEAAAPVVAEVGCGQAVPGLTAALLGARKLILQDYNAEVLQACVKPNLAATLAFPGNEPLLSSASSASPLLVKLVHGDWVDLDCDDCDGGCDVILGADVTFDTEACAKLASLLSRWLKPGSGVALIATKVFYFGTNGGALEFTECASRYKLYVNEVARMEEDGGMKRVILKVTQAA